MKKCHVVLLFFIVCYCVLIAGSRLLPFIDLPMHLASAKIYANIGKTENSFSTFYSINPVIPNPNILHLLLCSKWQNIELANKIFYLLYIILLPLSTILFIKKLGGNIWFSLLCFIFLFNYSVGWGFTGYTLAIPLVLFFLYLLYGYILKPLFLKSALLIFLSLFIFFAHGLAAMYALSVFATTVLIMNWKKPKRIVSGLALMLPLALLISAWMISTKEDFGNNPFLPTVIDYYLNFFWGGLWERCAGLFYWDNYFLASGNMGKIVGVAFSVSVLLILLAGLLINKKSYQNQQSVKFLLVILGISLIWYFFLPHKHYFLFFYFRFSVYIFLLLITLVSLFAPRLSAHLKFAIIFLIFIHFGLWGNYFREFQKDSAEFTSDLFPNNQPNYRLAGLIFEPYYRGQPIFHHFPNYYILWKNGIAVTKIIDFYNVWIVDRKTDFDTLPHYNPWVGTNKYDGRFDNMELLLTKGTIPENGRDHFELYELVKQKGTWRLFKKKHQ